jgi:hypothetical protein
MEEPTRCPGEWFGVGGTGDLDPGLCIAVAQGGHVRTGGRPPAIAFSLNRGTTLLSPVSTPERSLAVALATFALGMVLFALFFGLVAACDRL